MSSGESAVVWQIGPQQFTHDELLKVWQGQFRDQDGLIWLTVPDIEAGTVRQVNSFLTGFGLRQHDIKRTLVEGVLSQSERLTGLMDVDQPSVETLFSTAQLESISWEPEGFEVVYDDGGMFGHHMLIGRFDHFDRLIEVDFAG
ncbi:hypothetical protein E7T06_16615 [Deinococcus sp. Arct2-2]|uniref:hypothetical protein n=1 Tax=Deinococcus sp. Arct2-2 TaxID=2568653 RepID=UPI0010A4A438|nr:hypothetical protein [Deinococcus sp. Arct2-2]THF68368.1 hypothetical protein E7T06_16615 [Deinococcus sp. Arct2-2]